MLRAEWNGFAKVHKTILLSKTQLLSVDFVATNKSTGDLAIGRGREIYWRLLMFWLLLRRYCPFTAWTDFALLSLENYLVAWLVSLEWLLAKGASSVEAGLTKSGCLAFELVVEWKSRRVAALSVVTFSRLCVPVDCRCY